MEPNIDHHIQEMLQFLELITNSQFKGKDCKIVARLHEYLSDVVTQLAKIKLEQERKATEETKVIEPEAIDVPVEVVSDVK